MAEWFSIEVLDGATSAQAWADGHGDAIVAAAQVQGATDWRWDGHTWGVVLELELPDELAWDRLRALASVLAALDAVPDPVWGVIMHRGRGGTAGAPVPRRPKPFAGAGAVACPLPDVTDIWTEAVSSRVLAACGS